MEIESFYVKFGAIGDDGLMQTTVIVGFAGDPLSAPSVEIDLKLPEQLDVPLSGLREQARQAAAQYLHHASWVLENTSADQLHKDMLELREQARAADLDAVFRSAESASDRFQS